MQTDCKIQCLLDLLGNLFHIKIDIVLDLAFN